MHQHVIRLKSGEQVIMREAPEGAVCPVCGAFHGGGLAYDLTQTLNSDGTPAGEPFGGASFDTCPCCGTEFGNDDYVESGSVEAKWHELRLAWLDRVGWNDEAIRQLQQNLEIDPATRRRSHS